MATCVVSGLIKDPSETVIEGVIIKANIVTPFFTTTIHIVPKEINTESSASGTWSLTLSQSQSYRVTFEYPPNSTDSSRRYDYAITTPATSTANFSSLVTEV